MSHREPDSTSHGAKPSREDIAKAVHTTHQHICDAVHKVLHDVGLAGVRVHSLRLMVPSDAFSEPECNPGCSADEDCVLDSSEGQIKWVCVRR